MQSPPGAALHATHWLARARRSLRWRQLSSPARSPLTGIGSPRHVEPGLQGLLAWTSTGTGGAAGRLAESGKQDGRSVPAAPLAQQLGVRRSRTARAPAHLWTPSAPRAAAACPTGPTRCCRPPSRPPPVPPPSTPPPAAAASPPPSLLPRPRPSPAAWLRRRGTWLPPGSSARRGEALGPTPHVSLPGLPSCAPAQFPASGPCTGPRPCCSDDGHASS